MAALFRQPLGSLTTDSVEQLPSAIRRVIIRTLEERVAFPVLRQGGETFVGSPNPYGKFAALVRQLLDDGGSVSVLTFNYDLAVDFAFYKENIDVDYSLTDDVRPVSLEPSHRGVFLLKLHGSMNWVPCVNSDKCPSIVAYGMKDLRPDRMFWDRPLESGATERLRISRALNHCPRCRADAGQPRPVIVPPTWNKNHNGVAPVWRRAAQRLRYARNIVIVGYSLPSTDHFFRYLYALGSMGETRLQRFLVINPDRTVERRFRRLLGRGAERRFEYWEHTFGSSLDHLIDLFKGHSERATSSEPLRLDLRQIDR